MAKKHKAEDKINLAQKFDATGRSLQEIQDEKEGQNRKFSLMIKTIQDSIRSAKLQRQLPNKKFYFIHFNILCEVKNIHSWLLLTYIMLM